MGIKQSTLADAAPNPHAAHARLHRALEHLWPTVDQVIALGHFAPCAPTISSLIPLLTSAAHSQDGHAALPLPLPDPVAAHLAAMLASYALIDLQILHLKQMAAASPTGHASSSLSVSPKTPTLALRLAINARPLSSISGMTARTPKTRRQHQQLRSKATNRPSSAPTANSGSGLPLHTPDLPSARLPTTALSDAHMRRISAGGANPRTSQPAHASPRSTKSSKSPLILSWLAPHVHYAHVIQLALATLGPSCLLPPDPIPLVAQPCTVDDLAQILAFAINLWAATACFPGAPAGFVDSEHASSHFVAPVSPSQSLHPPHPTVHHNHYLSPTTTFSPSPSTRSIYHPPSHRISGATINSSIFRPPTHPYSHSASAHVHRPGSLFSTLSSTSTNDPGGANGGNASSIYTDQGSTLPDLETRTLRGHWDGGGGRAASLMPVRSMTLSFQGTSDEDDEDDEQEQDDAESVASSVEPPEALSSSSASAAAGVLPLSPTSPDMISSPLPHTPPTTTVRPAGGGASPLLAPLAPATLSVASTHTRRHRAGSMTSTTADSGGAGAGAHHNGDRAAATATATADRWSIRSHYPAPSVLSAQTSAVGSSMYHYQSPAPQRTSYGGGGGQHRSTSFGTPSSPTNGHGASAHVHYPPPTATTPAVSPPTPVVIAPSHLRPLAHRLIDRVSSTCALDWDAMVRLVLYPMMPYLWTWSLSPYLGMRMLGILGSHILPTHAPSPMPPPAAAGNLLYPSVIAHWLVQSSLVPPRTSPNSGSGSGSTGPGPPTLCPLAGHVVFRATANGEEPAAAVVALVALAVPFTGSTDVEPVVLALDLGRKASVMVVSPTNVVQRVQASAAAPQSHTVVAASATVGRVSVAWRGRGGSGLSLPVDVGAVGPGPLTDAGVGGPGPVTVVLSVLDVEVVVFA
ncbi:hypothetical protein BCR44DRAFT_1439062 [Catenaria anguillulae PL171]|uniref:Uncharacterized protein n=1 Tax=Catenaria anguillulae PL171 TaxID=765915 RepID=A0A1Y2HEW4_9FUNG|nr:hypothetical protein BCR44DRAFT_1439062 [Catenaria anguillulae PL171]